MNFAQMLFGATCSAPVKTGLDRKREVGLANLKRAYINKREAAKEKYSRVMQEPVTCPQIANALGMDPKACKTTLIRYANMGLCAVVGVDSTSKSNHKPKLWKWNNE